MAVETPTHHSHWQSGTAVHLTTFIMKVGETCSKNDAYEVGGAVVSVGSPAGEAAQRPGAGQQRLAARSPRPALSWTGTLDAFDEHIRCVQRFTKSWITGYENCLTLNIYTPAHSSGKPYPVMVYIHGGGFRDGSGSPFLYGPEYLMKHGIILVTFNYRLEVMGFLCLGIKEASGNMGLKDQVAALRWIMRNIKVFGGDPDNITLFGESAGSASVLYHIVSPLSKGLFHKAILQSGSAISPWSTQFEPLKTASLLAREMGHVTNDPQQLYQLFKNKTPMELLSTRVPRAIGDITLSENIFVPCIENVIDNNEQFITNSPYNLILLNQFNKVPLIIGYNDAEGYMFVAKENETTITDFNVLSSLPRDLSFPSEIIKIKTAKELQDLYFDESSPKTSPDKLAKYQGDSCIVFPVVKTIDMLLKYSEEPIYSYKFSRDGWMNLVKILFGFGRFPGASHADELFYIFKTGLELPIALLETDVISKMTTMWTNFAKYKN
ncbi:unnamed protein product [Leptidea sinapis]|uniref:Carboxylic ester hydrolase n=1 Tax=Leptidea sinapis TaxID=189913 RepID=A0A5E4QFQ5_9NEOP|nr:unnamed protein product [Leptidea sinapis]